jgi:hypothetical protein
LVTTCRNMIRPSAKPPATGAAAAIAVSDRQLTASARRSLAERRSMILALHPCREAKPAAT